MKTLIPFLAASALFAFPWPAPADEDEHREHDAHVHGVSALNIAVEGDQLVAEFSSPAMNIVGFEHQPGSAEQRGAVERAAENLERGGDWLVLPADASCRLTEARVESELLAADHSEGHDHGDEHDHEDDHDAEGRGDEEDPAHDDADHAHEHDETHSEFQVSYEFTCGDTSVIETVEVRLFDRFPGIERIEVQALSAAGQFGGDLVPGDNVIKLTQ